MQTLRLIILGNIGMSKELELSIITVSKNAENTIGKTIKSVLNQIYSNYEYIIIDGESTDNTKSVINSYETAFIEKGVDFRTVSEKDDGIYNAMNKGIRMARGVWVIFMNANDCFYSDNTLQVVFGGQYGNNVQCIYGDTINHKNGVDYFKRAYPIDTIYYKAPFIHQALFCRKTVLERYMFDERYLYAAEYDQFLRMYLEGISFKHVDIIIARFDMSGVSQNKSKDVFEEWKIIQKENHIYHKKVLKRSIRNLELFFKGNHFINELYLKSMVKRSQNMKKENEKL